jgi:ATP diphosphatase
VFDWPDAQGVRAKILEVLREIDEEVAAGRAETVAQELGDLLFAAANWGRHLHADPEDALRGANRKFEQRFRRMEQAAARRGLALEALSAEQWDELWRESKRHDTRESGA